MHIHGEGPSNIPLPSIANLRIQVLLLVLIPLVIFYPVLFAGFNSLDDKGIVSTIINSYDLYDTQAWLRLFFRERATTYYRPLVWSSFLMDYRLHLCDPSFMHLENILLHTLNGLLVFFLARRLIQMWGGAGASWVPFVAAIIFVIHPVNIEAVDWIAARTDLMAGFFVFLSFLFVLMGRKQKRWSVFPFLAGLAYFFGLLSKEVALGALPALAALLFIIKREQHLPTRYACIILTVFVLFTGVYLSMRGLGLEKEVHQAPQEFAAENRTNVGGQNSAANRIVYATGLFIKATGFYFKKLFWPWPLNFAIVKINKGLCLAIGLFVFAVGVFLLARKLYLPTFCLLWAWGFVLPAIGVIYAKVAWTPLAERYVYVSSFGGALALSWALNTLIESKKAAKWTGITFMVVVLLVFGYSTYARNLVWQSNLALYKDTVAKSPGFAAVHNEYALALWKAGKRDKARDEFRIGARLAGVDDYQYVGKANALAVSLSDSLDLAEKYYTMAVKVNNSRIKKWLLDRAIKLIGQQILATEDCDRKRQLYRQQIRCFKEMAKLRNRGFYTYRIGQSYLALGMEDEAVRYFEGAARICPNSIYGKAAKKILLKLADQPIG